jgi:hypothetical protein
VYFGLATGAALLNQCAIFTLHFKVVTVYQFVCNIKYSALKPTVIRYVGIEPGQEYWRLLYHWGEKAVYLKTNYINFKGYLL